MTDLVLLLIAVACPLAMVAVGAVRRRRISSGAARRLPARDARVVQGEYDLEWLRAIRHVSRDQVEVGRR